MELGKMDKMIDSKFKFNMVVFTQAESLKLKITQKKTLNYLNQTQNYNISQTLSILLIIIILK